MTVLSWLRAEAPYPGASVRGIRYRIACGNPDHGLDNLIGNYLSGGAEITWKNETGTTQNYLVRVYSPATRTGSYSCTFNVRLDVNGFTADATKAMSW